jgi:hypothetical protein
MTRVLASLGLTFSVLSLLALPWSRYGDIEIALHRFPGWQVHAASALALQALVLWSLFRPGRLSRARLGAGIACAATTVASAIVLGSQYNNATAFFKDVIPLVWPTPGLGPFVAATAALVSLGALILAHVTGSRRAQPLRAAARG